VAGTKPGGSTKITRASLTRLPARLGPAAAVVVMVSSPYRMCVLTNQAMIAAAWPPRADVMAAPCEKHGGLSRPARMQRLFYQSARCGPTHMRRVPSARA
jgi:hypothetical protein